MTVHNPNDNPRGQRLWHGWKVERYQLQCWKDLRGSYDPNREHSPIDGECPTCGTMTTIWPTSTFRHPQKWNRIGILADQRIDFPCRHCAQPGDHVIKEAGWDIDSYFTWRHPKDEA